jgi:hypothetical protein
MQAPFMCMMYLVLVINIMSAKSAENLVLAHIGISALGRFTTDLAGL